MNFKSSRIQFRISDLVESMLSTSQVHIVEYVYVILPLFRILKCSVATDVWNWIIVSASGALITSFTLLR